MKLPRPGLRARRAAFACYALTLATATHWPGLAVASPYFSRLDLIIHAGAFGAWTFLLIHAAPFGPARAPRSIGLCSLVALAYAFLDELTQGIPALQRTVDKLDLAANSAGIVVASALLAWGARPPDAADHAS